jgi:hypothetical protein
VFKMVAAADPLATALGITLGAAGENGGRGGDGGDSPITPRRAAR